MKFILLSFLLLSSMVSYVQAEETETECLQMREQNDRTNPKSNLAKQVKKPEKESVASDQ